MRSLRTVLLGAAIAAFVAGCGAGSVTRANDPATAPSKSDESTCAQPLSVNIGRKTEGVGGCGGTYGVAASLKKPIPVFKLGVGAVLRLRATPYGKPAALGAITVRPASDVRITMAHETLLIRGRRPGLAELSIRGYPCIATADDKLCDILQIRVA